MSNIKKLLLKQLQKHSTHYIESSKRGIVVDDLDVDSFIDEVFELVEVKKGETLDDDDKLRYRVVEYFGSFTIETRGYEEKGILWWKRKEWNWYRTNYWGGVMQTYPIPQPLSKIFDTLEEAQQCINGWERGEIYHYI